MMSLIRGIGVVIVSLTALSFIVACALLPFIALLASREWVLGPEESDLAIVCLLAGNVTGFIGFAIVGWVASLFEPIDQKGS